MRTEKDIGAKNPETWAVSGFRFYLLEQVKNSSKYGAVIFCSKR
ncbi:MAG: hypothetical protein UHH95_05930 [Oscillospiraceae bacterium]|nr:hypothetical protein [Oscillospiraceae bacterium]